MRLMVIGGRLQGTEAVYLAAKAGYETVLVDRHPSPPAAGLATRHVVADIMADADLARRLALSCDAVLPACEDAATLAWLAEQAAAWQVPLLFDLHAHEVTRSKLRSHALFDELGIARPAPWPECGFPAIVKPDGASGSEAITLARDGLEVEHALAALAEGGHAAVVEEWVPGPSLSLEVLGWGGEAQALQVTGLEFDERHDCRRVVAPVGERQSGEALLAGPSGHNWMQAVEAGVLARFSALSERLAQGLHLAGVMDVEVMVRDGREPLVLEIDARLPSQTPSAVYWSSGVNIVAELTESFHHGALRKVRCEPARACVYEHVLAQAGRLSRVGEHVVRAARPLRLVPDFYGADEALTDYEPGATSWVATIISTAATLPEAQARAREVLAALAARERLAPVEAGS